MTPARRDGLYLLLLGSAIFLLFGLVLMIPSRLPLVDFRTAYYSGQCLLQHGDPYNASDIQALYANRTERAPVPPSAQLVITRNIYLPPAFALTVPLALLPFNLAQALWCLLIVGSFILASFLMWIFGARHAPVLSGALLCFCLANSGSLVLFGNPAGFVVPLCVIAACCFIDQRFVVAGILCLAVGLVFKPHDTGLIWLYFILAGGTYRKPALQTLGVVLACGVPAVLWMTHISPHWISEIASNFQAFSGPGGLDNPAAGHGTSALTSLQAITSFFWTDPHVYNLVSYAICAFLLLGWVLLTMRSRPSLANTWLALAAVACLSMLPVYHRQYDAKIILLTIPACALLWAHGGPMRWLSLLVTSAGFILNGDLPWAFFLTALAQFHFSTVGPHGKMLTALMIFPVPLSLLGMALFYLWAYAHFVFHPKSPQESGNLAGTLVGSALAKG